MISRSRSAPTAAAMSIECTTSANSTVTCLYSAAVGGWRDRRAALVTELGVRRQLRAARPTRQSRCCQSTATVARWRPRQYRFTAGRRCPSYRCAISETKY